MLYGIDTVGASNTHLQRVRATALAASLPPGAGRNVDVAFSILDGSNSSKTDPAYYAHVAPIKHWGMALWQQWVP